MTIDRRQILTLAWKRAKAQAEWFPTIRAAFVAAEAEVKARPVANPAGWERENTHRARAVAARANGSRHQGP